MTPQELKSSILQLAIQGKLVEQRPEEGTGEELYRQIQKEKQELFKEGKIKKEKPLPEISEDEIPFDIPESWKWVRLGDICSIYTGKKDANFGSDSGEYFFFTCAREPIRCNSFSFSGESILLAGNGDIGNVSYYFGEFEAYQRTYVLQPYIEFSYLKYILYHLQYNWVSYNKDKIYGTAIPYIRLGNVQNYLIALPPLAEQNRIIAKIEELLPYIDRYEQAWSKLENFNKRFPVDMQKSILQMAIQGKLVEHRPEEGTGEELFQQIQAEKQKLIKEGKIKKEKPLPEISEDEIPFDIPESWKWVRFLSVVDIATNLVPPTEYLDYLHIAPDNIEKATGRLLKCHTVGEDNVVSANHLFYKGQIIYSKIRPLLRKAVIAPFNGLCSADMYPLNTTLNTKYVLFYLLSDGYNVQIAEVMSSRVKMPKINRNELAKILLPLPPLAEQKRIVAKLEEILPLCRTLEQKTAERKI